MATKLSDLVIMSDVDGTLLIDGKIPQRNIEAVERFVSKGGHFAIASGRSVEYAKAIQAQFPVNYPCVYFNGGVLYDPVEQKHLMDLVLPETAKGYIPQILERFPDIGLIVVKVEDYYDIQDDISYRERRNYFNNRVKFAKLEDLLGDTWYKVLLFVDPGKQNEEFFAFVNRFQDVRVVETNETMREMLPLGSSKGEALTSLMKITGLKRENLVCIGDYYNDKEMIELAGIGATLCDAPQDLQDLAQIIVGPCVNGAVADLIEKLEELYG